MATNTAQSRNENPNEPNAIEYEFYIPDAIFNTTPVADFISMLEHFQEGATVFAHEIGIWQGTLETTHIYRTIVLMTRYQRDNARMFLRREIERLMHGLGAAERQDAIVFSEKEVLWTVVE